jgi:hypothetical protein
MLMQNTQHATCHMPHRISHALCAVLNSGPKALGLSRLSAPHIAYIHIHIKHETPRIIYMRDDLLLLPAAAASCCAAAALSSFLAVPATRSPPPPRATVLSLPPTPLAPLAPRPPCFGLCQLWSLVFGGLWCLLALARFLASFGLFHPPKMQEAIVESISSRRAAAGSRELRGPDARDLI